jgi:hypothetical protein
MRGAGKSASVVYSHGGSVDTRKKESYRVYFRVQCGVGQDWFFKTHKMENGPVAEKPDREKENGKEA